MTLVRIKAQENGENVLGDCQPCTPIVGASSRVEREGGRVHEGHLTCKSKTILYSCLLQL